jgi:glycosyltransferase involved in cell wall biosynthesis
MGRPRLLFLITEDWYFWSHRRPLAEAARDAGFDVTIATRVQEHGEAIRELGIGLVPVRLRRSGRNPAKELLSIVELATIYRRRRPTIVHHVGVKPMLYGSWAARICGVPGVVNAQAGLGYVFTGDGARAAALRAGVKAAYRSAWSGENTRVVFQNQDNLDFFVASRVVPRRRAVLIRGCGVELDRFRPSPEPAGLPVVMMTGRMLWDKGIAEIVEAAKLLRARRVPCHVVLLGQPDPDNPESVPERFLREQHAAGVVEWWGHLSDMPGALAQSTLVVLPSYSEGLPMSLVEAAAAARPMVTTDVPGCRDVVRHGDNGLLVPPRDAPALADAIAELLGDPSTRAAMGRRSRVRAEQEFSSDAISRQTITLYEGLLGSARGGRTGGR